MWDLSLTPMEAEALWLSLKTGAVGTLLSLPFGILIAWALARGRFPGKLALDLLVHLPLVLPPVVTGYLLRLTIGRHGWLGGWLEAHLGLTLSFNWKGAAIAAAVMGFPLMVRAMRLSFETVDTKLEAAARTLGATRLDVFVSITLPLISPGLIVGTLLCFARAIGEFGATITFVGNIPGQTQTLPIALYSVLQTPNGDAFAVRLVVISIILALGSLAASEYFSRKALRRIRGNDAVALR